VPNRLLRYELALFRRSFEDAFGRARDKLLLLFMALLAIAAAPQWLDRAAAAPIDLPLMWVAAPVALLALGWQRILHKRMKWLAEETVFAPDALGVGPRFRYLATAHLPALLLVSALLLVLTHASASAAAAIPAYAAGLIFASAANAIQTSLSARIRRREGERSSPRQVGRRAAFQAILSRQTMGSSRPMLALALLLAAELVLTMAAVRATQHLAEPVRVAAALAPSILLLLIGSRMDPQLFRFLAYLGHPPRFVALSLTVLPAASFAAAAAGALAGRSAETHQVSATLILLLIVHAAAACLLIARAWLYPGQGPRSAHFRVEVEFGAIALVALMMPPLAPVVLIWRMLVLRGRYKACLWVQQ
jgi:hypothetical protein